MRHSPFGFRVPSDDRKLVKAHDFGAIEWRVPHGSNFLCRIHDDIHQGWSGNGLSYFLPLLPIMAGDDGSATLTTKKVLIVATAT